MEKQPTLGPLIKNGIHFFSHRKNPTKEFDFENPLYDVYCFTECSNHAEFKNNAPSRFKHLFIRQNPLKREEGGLVIFWNSDDLSLVSIQSAVMCDFSSIGMVSLFHHKPTDFFFLFTAWYSVESSQNIKYGKGLERLQKVKQSFYQENCVFEFDLIDPLEGANDRFFSFEEKDRYFSKTRKNVFRNWLSESIERNNKRIASIIQKEEGFVVDMEAERLKKLKESDEKRKEANTEILNIEKKTRNIVDDIRKKCATFLKSVDSGVISRSSYNQSYDTMFSQVVTVMDNFQSMGPLFQELCVKYEQAKKDFETENAARAQKVQTLHQIPSIQAIGDEYVEKVRCHFEEAGLSKLLAENQEIIKKWKSGETKCLDDCPKCKKESYITEDGYTYCIIHGIFRGPGETEDDERFFRPEGEVLFHFLKKYFPTYYHKYRE